MIKRVTATIVRNTKLRHWKDEAPRRPSLLSPDVLFIRVPLPRKCYAPARPLLWRPEARLAEELMRGRENR